MKKVLFVIINMEIGGTRTSLLNLLNNLRDDRELEIDVLVLSPRGELFTQLPKCFTIKSSGYFLKAYFDEVGVKRPISSLVHICIAVLKKLLGYERVFGVLYRSLAKKIKKDTVYDAIIGFQEGISDDVASVLYGLHHYSWVHSNIDVWYDDKDYCESTFINSERIIFVAEATKDRFVQKFPIFKEKCMVIKNTICPEEILDKSKYKFECSIDNTDIIKFVSVGRFNSEKAFDRIVEVSNVILKQHKKAFKWYIIGDGVEKRKIEKLISDYNLGDSVILLGAMSNPYPVIASCDCLVLTSLSESQPMVMLESLILGVPVITTNFESAVEIAKGESHTYICDNSIEGIEKAVSEYICDKELRCKMKTTASKFKYDCSNIIMDIKKLF